MRLLSLEHVPHEGPGRIADWALERGYSVSHCSLAAGDVLPEQGSYDLLIVMGGPMNIYEHRSHPWLPVEKAFIAEAIRLGKPALGICLGAQLISDVLGGKVMQNPEYEMGWFPASFSGSSESALFKNFPAEMTVMHWHGDTFTLPPGAVHIGHSTACVNQAYSWNDRVAGLQFHIELDMEIIRQLAADGFIDQWPGKYVQTEEEIVSFPLDYEPLRRALYGLLDGLAAKALVK